jgi:hypothetical protein
MRKAFPEELAYIAGLVDGEGSVSLSRTHAEKWRAPVLSISNTVRELLELPKEIFGGTIITKGRKVKAHHLTIMEYKIAYRPALEAMIQISPYMRHPEKKRRISLLVEGYQWYTRRNGKYSDFEIFLKRQFEDRFLRSIDGLNARGVKIKRT